MKRAWAICSALLLGCGELYDPAPPPFSFVGPPVPLANTSAELRLQRRGVDLTSDRVRVSFSSDEVRVSLSQLGPFVGSVDLDLDPGETQSVPFFAQGQRAGKATASITSDRQGAKEGTLEVASTIVAEDFETGTLRTTPGGPWEAPFIEGAITWGFSEEAAHRGASGLRIVDRDSSPGDRGSPAQFSARMIPYSGDHFVRAWVRVSNTSAVGATHLIQTTRTGSPGGLAAYEVQVLMPDREVLASGYAAGVDAPHLKDPAGSNLADGSWHLFELGVFRLGTASGERRLWLDGALVSNRSGVNFSSQMFDADSFGMPWSDDLRFTGTVDFDDIRTSNAPMGSRLSLEMEGAGGTCARIAVSLRDAVSHSRAAAPYDLELTWTGLEGPLYGDSGCSREEPSPFLPRGETGRAFFVRATSPAQLTVSHPDFLVSVPLDLSPLPAQGCSTGGGGLGSGLLCLAALAGWLGRANRRDEA